MANNATGYDFRAPRPFNTPVGSGDGGGYLEARIAKLEAHVEHIQSDVSEIKADIRSLRDKVDKIKEAIQGAKVWAVLLYVGLTAGLLYAMAKGFKWLS